ncbi:MAG: mechanosensitive ion channel family protein [Pseudomonadales bacterium]
MEYETVLEGLKSGASSDEGLLMWVFLVVLGIAVMSFIARVFLHRLELQLQKTRTPWDDALVSALRRPVYVMIWVVGLGWVSNVLYMRTNASIFSMADDFQDMLVILVLIWFVVRFIRAAERGILQSAGPDSSLDAPTVIAASKLFRTAIVVTGVLVMLQTLGYNISGVLAFGSIGGLAVSFAAKDLLANFFGGLMVYLDRPFAIGDWIRSPDKSIEGTVEYIGWRTTRIRTFAQRPLYVPNSVFTQIAVENPSRMNNRRIYETIGVRYDDVEVLQKIINDVRDMLRNHPEIDTGRTLIVNFNKFGGSSLDFFVYTFTKTTEWVRYHEIKEEVLLKISDIITGYGAEIAFPTSTVHLPVPPPEATEIQEQR